MYSWEKIQTKTELEYVLDVLKEKIGNSKVKRIFSSEDAIPKKVDNTLQFTSLSEPLYILFDNDYCLIIDFYFYSEIYIEYRKMTEDEQKLSINNISKKEIDYFNGHHEIYSWDFDDNNKRIEESFRVKHIVDISGQYDEIVSFSVNGFHDEYDKWISDGSSSDIITIPAGGDYFNALIITLKNGIQIEVLPQTADDDGYYDLKVYDKDHIINFNQIEK